MRTVVLWIILFGFLCLSSSVEISRQTEPNFVSFGSRRSLNWFDILSGSSRSSRPTEESKKSTHDPKTHGAHSPTDRRGLLQQIRKARIAALMEKRYQEQRSRIEEASRKSEAVLPFRGEGLDPLKSPHLYPERRKTSEGNAKTQLTRPLLVPRPSRGNHLEGETPKILRYAEEAKSGLRPSGLRPEARPVFPQASLPLKAYQEQAKEPKTHGEQTPTPAADKERQFLDARLSGSLDSLSFDPSIVVNFSLLDTSLIRKELKDASGVKAEGRPSKFLTVISKNPTKENINYAYKKYSQEEESEEDRVIAKRGKGLELPSKSYSNASFFQEPMALYVAVGTPTPDQHHEPIREPSPQKPPVRLPEDEISEFGPYSKGNDPSAGIDPSEVHLPEMDISRLSLPESVRDSLRNYLEPLLASLKPLTKSVPGLPGLDYPILSVVPYTNFYCSNMPFPGFYADTEARCQTWHACDVDGRQATFLCPNGTVFNQALMVCDWWYNSNCLDAPFYYTLNNRLFGHLTPTRTTTPYNRITLELLDTIFL